MVRMATVLGLSLFTAACDSAGSSPDAALVPDAPTGTATLAPAQAMWGTCSNLQPCPTKMFTVTAAGATPALQVALVGTDAGRFSIASDACSGKPLAKAATCTIEVSVVQTGNAYGKRVASLQVSAASPFTVSSALSADYEVSGDLFVSPATGSFGSQTIGTSSAPKTFTITNPSSFATGMLGVQKSGSDPNEFTITSDTCASHQLAGFATCTFDVVFSPTSAGAKSVDIDIAAAPGGTVHPQLTGTGN